MGFRDKMERGQNMLRNGLPCEVREWWNLHRMRSYWNICAKDNARKHIAIDDWESEEAFHRSGLRDLKTILDGCGAAIPAGARVLEIGCGIGRLLKPLALARRDLSIYGVDVSPEMILQGEKRLRDFPNIYLSRVNGKDLVIFKDNFFDFIFSYVTFQHIPRRYVQELFKEVNRVIKRKGIFTFQMQWMDDDGREEPPDSDYRTVRSYTPDMLQAMCSSAGFTVLEIRKPGKKGGYLYSTVTKGSARV